MKNQITILTNFWNKHHKLLTRLSIIAAIITIIIHYQSVVTEYENLLHEKDFQLAEQFSKELILADLEFVRQDIEMYGYVSTQITNTIVQEIKNSSDHYKIPIGLLHAIFRVESDYRFHITHPDVVLKNGIKINAIGLGGVVWYF